MADIRVVDKNMICMGGSAKKPFNAVGAEVRTRNVIDL